MSIEKISNLIPTKLLNMADLQGPQITMQALLQDLKKALDALSKAIATNNLNTIYVVDQGKEIPIMSYVSNNLKIDEKTGKSNMNKLIATINRTLKDTNTLHAMNAFAVDNNTKEGKGENRPEFLNKIKIELEPSQKPSTNLAMGPVKVNPRENGDTGKTVKETENASSKNDNDKGIKLTFDQNWLINKVLFESLGYG